jgi:hypothetical protein
MDIHLTREDDAIPPMPLRLHELLVVIRALQLAAKSEEVDEKDREIINRIAHRINRFSERQGASWDAS